MPKSIFIVTAGCALFFSACSHKPEPVDIYPDDNCSACRMAISDKAFAAEYITEDGDALKFDDIGCLQSYMDRPGIKPPAATYVVDYHTKTWLPLERSVIVRSNIATPMGSGQVAFSDSASAKAFQQAHRAHPAESQTSPTTALTPVKE